MSSIKMESLSKQELISTITKQADQIKRYETRLRDVVTAYKGLAKEKEALEISLKALNQTDNKANGGSGDESLAALSLSLATMTAEKARMEEAFQADKKVTRDKYESLISTLKDETKSLVLQHQAEISNLRAKIAYEIQERENQTADHAAMMKEFQMKFNVERKTKEKLEDKYASTSEAQLSSGELEKRARDLARELEATRRRAARAEARGAETPALLLRLQEKMTLLEQRHAIAIREEQIKSNRAEESARKACARQEERVGLLEARLAELSATVGQYDARRRRDQATIHQLRDQLNAGLLHQLAPTDREPQPTQKSETDNEKLADSEYLQTLIDKIHILKKELLAENEKLGGPVDVAAIFRLDGYEHVHLKCREALENLRQEFDFYKKQTQKDSSGEVRSENEKIELNLELMTLRETMEEYKVLLVEEKTEKADTIKALEDKLKSEQQYHAETCSELRTRIACLEKQAAAQRERYAALLGETDRLVRARADRSRRVSAEESHAALPDVTSPPHMLHYAHELARKDLDISQLRKDKHILEGHLRDCQRDSTIEKERYKEVVRNLKEEIERLRRSQSREGANLEYLKNVVMAYVLSVDDAGRKHMLNAIAAVLHFTNTEKNLVLATL